MAAARAEAAGRLWPRWRERFAHISKPADMRLLERASKASPPSSPLACAIGGGGWRFDHGQVAHARKLLESAPSAVKARPSRIHSELRASWIESPSFRNAIHFEALS